MTWLRVVVDPVELHSTARHLATESAAVADTASRLPTDLPEAPAPTAGPVCEALCAIQAELRSLSDELVVLGQQLTRRADDVETAETRWCEVGAGGVSYGCSIPGGEIVTIGGAALTAASAAWGPGLVGGTAISAASGGPAGNVTIIGGTGTWPGAATAAEAIFGNSTVIGGDSSFLGQSQGLGGGVAVVGGGGFYGGGGPGGAIAAIGSGGFTLDNPAGDAAGNALGAEFASILSGPNSAGRDVNSILSNQIVTSGVIAGLGRSQSALGAAQSASILGARYTTSTDLSGYSRVEMKQPWED